MTKDTLTVFGRFNSLGRDGNPARLGIMGGTFDPIHLGHLRVAEEVKEALRLDGVLFIPTGDPVFKKDQSVTDGSVRLDLLIKALANNPSFDVSAMELQRPGNTYTVDTLKALREIFPAAVELFFIVGSDAAQRLDGWKDPQSLASLARFAVAAGRPQGPSEEEIRDAALSAAPFRFDFVTVSALEISSAALRQQLAEGKSIRYAVPEIIRADVESAYSGPMQNALETGLPTDETFALSKEFYKARKTDLKERVSAERFEHSVNVAKTAERLAEIYGLNPTKARLAGILHDWDKGLNDEGIRLRVKELGLENQINPTVLETMARTLHGVTAAAALKREYPEIPTDVLQAIHRHTTANTTMEPLDMVLYVADGIEPSRHFGAVDAVREQVGKVELEELFFLAYQYWTALLMERSLPLHPDTIAVWNKYAKRSKARKDKHK